MHLKNCKETKVRLFIHCTSFSCHYNFLKILKNLIKLVALESHDRMKYYNGYYFEKIRSKLGKNEDENF